MLTMFEITIPGLGGWGSVVHVIIQEVEALMAPVFTLYVAVVCFATLQVTSALFIKQTMQIANSDQEAALAERMKQKSMYVQNLREVFHQVDKSGNGTVDIE